MEKGSGGVCCRVFFGFCVVPRDCRSTRVEVERGPNHPNQVVRGSPHACFLQLYDRDSWFGAAASEGWKV